jgi:hypothetical protein
MEKFGRWIAHEFREVLPPAIFFLLGFHMLTLTRSLMLREYGIHPATAAGATVGALLVAKVMLVADSFAVVNRFPERPLIYNVAWKTAIYALASLFAHYLEHLVPLWWRVGDLGTANHRLLTEIVWPQFWAVQLWLVVLLFMYCATRELIRAIGPSEVRRMFFGTVRSARSQGAREDQGVRAPDRAARLSGQRGATHE